MTLYLFENVAIVAWREASGTRDIEAMREFVMQHKAQGHAGMSFTMTWAVRSDRLF